MRYGAAAPTLRRGDHLLRHGERPSAPSSPMPTIDSQRVGPCRLPRSLSSTDPAMRVLSIGGTTEPRHRARLLAGQRFRCDRLSAGRPHLRPVRSDCHARGRLRRRPRACPLPQLAQSDATIDATAPYAQDSQRGPRPAIKPVFRSFSLRPGVAPPSGRCLQTCPCRRLGPRARQTPRASS